VRQSYRFHNLFNEAFTRHDSEYPASKGRFGTVFRVWIAATSEGGGRIVGGGEREIGHMVGSETLPKQHGKINNN